MFFLSPRATPPSRAEQAEIEGLSHARHLLHQPVPSGSAPKLTQARRAGKFLQVAPSDTERCLARVRLILENSTVCHSRRISLLCPVDALTGFLVGVLMVSLTMILANFS